MGKKKQSLVEKKNVNDLISFLYLKKKNAHFFIPVHVHLN